MCTVNFKEHIKADTKDMTSFGFNPIGNIGKLKKKVDRDADNITGVTATNADIEKQNKKQADSISSINAATHASAAKSKTRKRANLLGDSESTTLLT
jgi:hypothetical protein